MKKPEKYSVFLAEILIYVAIAAAYFSLGVWFTNAMGYLRDLNDYVFMAPTSSLMIILLGISILVWFYRNNRRQYKIYFWFLVCAILGYTIVMMLLSASGSTLTELSRQYNPEKLLTKATFFDLSPIVASLALLLLMIMLLRHFLGTASRLCSRLNMALSLLVFIPCYLIVLSYVSAVPIFYITDVTPVGLPAALLLLLLLIAIHLLEGKESLLYMFFSAKMQAQNQVKGMTSKSVLFYFLILMLVISFGGSFFVRISYSIVKATSVNNMNRFSTIISGQISEWYKRQITDLLAVYSNPFMNSNALAVINDTTDTNTINNVRQLINSGIRSNQFLKTTLYDTTGVEILSTSDTKSGTELSPDILLSLASDTDKILLTESQEYQQNDNQVKSTLNIWIPVLKDSLGTKESIAGVWQIKIDPQREIYPIVSQGRFFSKSGETVIFSRSANRITVLNRTQFKNNQELDHWISFKIRPSLANLAGSAEGYVILEGVDYRKMPVITLVSAVKDTPWFILLKINKREVFQPLKTNILIAVSSILLLILLLAMGIVLIERSRDRQWYKQQLELEYSRKQVEETLLETELNYRNILDNLIEGCQIIDSDLRYAYINKAYAKQFNKKGQDIVGLKMTEVYPGIDESPMFRMLTQCLQRQVSGNWESRIVREDGSIEWIFSRFQPMGDNLLILTSDITERKQAEAEIRNMNAELERKVLERTEQLQIAYNEMESFSYSVSHDLRAPLRAIGSFSEVLDTDYKTHLDEKGQDYLCRIRKASARMSELIDDILKLSRISRTPINLMDLELKPFIEKMLAQTIPTETDRISEITLDIRGSVKADESLLTIALTNIIDNAWKFTSYREKTLITIFTEETDRSVNLTVQDNGAGFDMKYADKLFSPFQRLHKIEEFHGTGIGLTIVQRIMQKHNGVVTIDSEKDVGTKVTLLFIK